MARRKVREYVEDVPSDSIAAASAAEELADQQVPEEEIGEIFRMTDELRITAGVVCQLIRTQPPNLAGYVGEISPSEFSLERVRKQYGPGTYTVRLKGPLGYVKGGGKLVIAPLPETSAGAPAGDSAAAIIEALDKRSEARGSELKSWAGILAPILAPVLLKFFDRKSEVTEMVQGLAALKGLTPDPPKPEPLEAQLDRIIGVMDKLKEAKGEPPSTGATWVDIVRDGIQGARPLLEGLAGRLMVPGAALPTLPPRPMIAAPAPFGPASGSSPSALSSAAPPSTPPMSQDTTLQGNGNVAAPNVSWLSWLRDNLQALIYQAGRNKDPGLYASVMLDNIPPGADPALFKGFIERPDWWAQLQQFAPGVTPYPAWFEEFRDAVLEIMNAPPEAPADSTPEAPATQDEAGESFT